jgi:hypothetical protein
MSKGNALFRRHSPETEIAGNLAFSGVMERSESLSNQMQQISLRWQLGLPT